MMVVVPKKYNNMNNYKFRIWNYIEKRFQENLYLENTFLNDILKSPYFLFQSFTGLFDKNKKEVYEGDIVKFKYWVGDNAWEHMTEEEVKWNESELGKEYIGIVEKEPTCNNLYLKVKLPVGNGIYNLAYAGGINAEIIGNIMENPEISNEPFYGY